MKRDVCMYANDQSIDKVSVDDTQEYAIVFLDFVGPINFLLWCTPNGFLCAALYMQLLIPN